MFTATDIAKWQAEVEAKDKRIAELEERLKCPNCDGKGNESCYCDGAGSVDEAYQLVVVLYLKEKKRAKAAEAECNRLNEWCDGFSDTNLKERATAEDYQKELRQRTEQAEAQVAALVWLVSDILQNYIIPFDDIGVSTFDRKSWRMKAVEALANLPAAAEKLLLAKRLIENNNNMCGCHFDEDEATVLRWCAAHGAIREEWEAKLDAAKKREREWIPTSERLPTGEDAGSLSDVLVRVIPHGIMHYELVLRRPNDVGAEYHTHWARIPDPPEKEAQDAE